MLFTAVLTSVALAAPGFNLFGNKKAPVNAPAPVPPPVQAPPRGPQPICKLGYGTPCAIDMNLLYGKTYIPVRSSQPAACTCSRERFVFGWVGNPMPEGTGWMSVDTTLPKLYNGWTCQTNTVMEGFQLGIFTPDLKQIEYKVPTQYPWKDIIQVWQTPGKGYSNVLYVQSPAPDQKHLSPVIVLLSENGQVSQEITSHAYQAMKYYGSKQVASSILRVVPQQGQCNFKQ